MIHKYVLSWPEINVDRILRIQEIKGDTIIFDITIDGLDVTNGIIRAELYDLNTSVKMINVVPSGVIPLITILSDAPSGSTRFQATVPWGATGTFQKFGQIEIEIEDIDGNRFTIFQQQIKFINERVVWNNPV